MNHVEPWTPATNPPPTAMQAGWLARAAGQARALAAGGRA